MRIPLAFGQNERTLPFLAKNSIAEKLPTGLVARCRPGFTQVADLGADKIRGVFWKAGLFDSALIVVADTGVWSVAANGVKSQFTGTVPGADRVTMDGGLDIDGNPVVRIATGSSLHKLTTAGVTTEDFPTAGGAGASDVAYSKGHWVAAEAGTDTVYFQIPGAPTWDPIEFAAAEYGADILQGLWPLGDYVYLLGSSTAEVWRFTGDATTVFAPVPGLSMDFGCRSRDSIASTGELLFWVDDQCQVRMTPGGTAGVVSEDWLQRKISEADPTHLRAWCCTWRGHPLYILTLGRLSGTYVFDAHPDVRLWSEWTSKDDDLFRGHLGVEADADVFLTDARSNSSLIWRLSEDAYSDAGDEIEHLVTLYQGQTEGRMTIGNVVLSCELGSAPMTGQGSDPKVGMRYSDDGGHTWSVWRFASTGARGNYKHAPRWNRCGQVKSPFGRLWQIRNSDPVLRVIYGLDANV